MTKEPKETPATKAFKAACNDLAEAFCKQLDVDYDDSWWVGDTPGDVFCIQGGDKFTDVTDMVLVIEHRLTYDEWVEWYWQVTETDDDMNILPNRINLRSWIRGARPKNNKH